MDTSQSAPTSSLMPRVGLVLTIVLFCLYAGFILIGAFSPSTLAAPVIAGSLTTYAFAYGIVVVLSTIVLAGAYIFIANIDEKSR